MIPQARIRHYMAPPPPSGRYLLYWLQASQRSRYNHALEWAVQKANERRLPLLVLFVLVPDFPEANLRHYQFMLEGIAGLFEPLARRNIRFLVRLGEPVREVAEMARDAAWLVMDKGYLRVQRQWRKRLIQTVRAPVTVVESDAVVPVELASDKAEYAARTLRPQIRKYLDDMLVPLSSGLCEYPDPELDLQGITETDPRKLMQYLPARIRRASVTGVSRFQGGEAAAHGRLDRFIQTDLRRYDSQARDPARYRCSGLGPYLHFGQISPLEIALRIQEANAPPAAREAFLEQLIVRRELAINFVWHTPEYDRYEAVLPHWANQTLAEHAADPRPYLYTAEQLESGQTHDPYWNAAQNEMVNTGMMHGYMRMYWGKKILEWSQSPQQAFECCLYLNNKYQLDGRDPNSFAGVAWCFGKHDQAWAERPVFGKVRYMNAAGLKRKFKMADYTDRWGN